jgi:predicted  nucleic acid-binding Zn-ribbon protein
VGARHRQINGTAANVTNAGRKNGATVAASKNRWSKIHGRVSKFISAKGRDDTDENSREVYFQQIETTKKQRGPNMKVEDIEKQLGDVKKKQSSLKAELAGIDDKAAALRDTYKKAVEAGKSETELDAMDQELYKLDRQHTRVEIRFGQCEREIETLQHERADAKSAEARDAYEQDVQAALIEAMDIEKIVQTLITVAAIHSQRLDRMRKYAEGVGVGQVPYRLVNLERRIQAVFSGGHSVNRVYKNGYPEILAGNIEAVERQIQRAPKASAAVAEQVDEQVAVNN